LIKALQYCNLSPQSRKALLTLARHAFDIAASGLCSLKRSTKNTLSTIQKVGRTTKNSKNTSNHEHLQGYTGYETP
jgi:hypothetical protein